MATTNTVSQRMNAIWREWGLAPDAASAKGQNEALEQLQKWLARGESDPAVVVRAVQLLLADPETPGVGERPATSEAFSTLVETWHAAGTGEKDVQFLQAMILAAWPDEAPGGFALAPLLESAWEVMAGRDKQRKRLSAWREGTVSTKSASPIAVLESSIEPIGFTRITLSDIEPQLQEFRNHSGVNWSFSGFGSHLIYVLEKLNEDIKALGRSFDSTTSILPQVLQRFLSQATSMISHAKEAENARSDLLWWGQARYCHTLRKPFRRIPDFKTSTEVLWWGAWEVAQRATELEPEPTAAYLVEVLHALGQDTDEKRPLLDWTADLHRVLTAAGDKVPVVGKPLARVAGGDALGLPVTWVRLQSEKRVSEAALLEAASDAVALPLSAEIDRGQWASWLLREALLDLRMAGLDGVPAEGA